VCSIVVATAKHRSRCAATRGASERSSTDSDNSIGAAALVVVIVAALVANQIARVAAVVFLVCLLIGLLIIIIVTSQIRQRTVAGVGSTTIAVNTQSDVMPARVNSSKYGISSLLLA